VEKARFDKMLKSEEIRTLITALGTGIGRDEYDINNLRYHKVIIMTDADVDGSHIRTLLLTFFYRMMPDLVDLGYLYLAQPPLYRVGKGKKAIYVKDDASLNELLMKRICDSKKVMTGDGDDFLRKGQLYVFLGNLMDYERVTRRFERRGYSRKLLELLMERGVKDKAFLKDEQRMRDVSESLVGVGYKPERITKDEEHNLFELLAHTDGNGKRDVKIGWELVSSPDYQKAVVIWKGILSENKPPFKVFENGKEVVSVSSKEELLSFLMKQGKKGISIQRYKGLGEMNPDQLWDTTMNREKRTLLKVKVEDMFEAHDVFTVLMGGEVEQRRNFIESNALEVQTLDI
jgi:DNA gyrase subunit B